MKLRIDTYHSLEVTDIIESLSMKLIYFYQLYFTFSTGKYSSEYITTFKMDYAKRLTWTRCVSDWSSRTTSKILGNDVFGMFSFRVTPLHVGPFHVMQRFNLKNIS